MYDLAREKLDDARQALEEMRVARDIPTFRRRFAAVISALKAVPDVLQAEGKQHFRKVEKAGLHPFSRWLQDQRSERQADPLINFVMQARNADQHEGKYSVVFEWTLTGPFKIGPDTPGRPPGSIVELGNDGPLWVIDPGMAGERRTAIDFESLGAGRLETVARLSSPPTEHLGAPVEPVDPVRLCELAIEYFATVVYEASSQHPWAIG